MRFRLGCRVALVIRSTVDYPLVFSRRLCASMVFLDNEKLLKDEPLGIRIDKYKYTVLVKYCSQKLQTVEDVALCALKYEHNNFFFF